MLLRRATPPNGERAQKRARVDRLEHEARAAVQSARSALAEAPDQQRARLAVIDHQLAILSRRRHAR